MKPDNIKDKLEEIVAGETVCWYNFERYLDMARPKTLSTLMKATRAEAALEATQDKMLTPKQVQLMTIVIIVFVAIIGLYLLKGLGIFGDVA